MLLRQKNHAFATYAKMARVSLITVVVFGLCCQIVLAQTNTRWIAVDGNWSDSANWDNGVPSGVMPFNAIIENGAGNISQDVTPFFFERLELRSNTANLIMDNFFTVAELDWSNGFIGGSDEFRVLNSGRIARGTLDTTFTNFGDVEFGEIDGPFSVLATTGNAVWNNVGGSTFTITTQSQLGSFMAIDAGQFYIQPNSLFKVDTNVAQIVMDIDNQGEIEINGSNVLFLADYVQSDSGQLKLNDAVVDFFQATEIEGKIVGSGSILNLNANGLNAEVDPGGAELGTIEVAGPLVMTPTTVSNFQIGPGQSSDMISNIGGPLQLNGTLNITALPGATPGVYTLFSYNNGSNLATDDIQLGTVPAGFKGFLSLQTNLQCVKLVVEAIDPVVLLGDVNLDGEVDLLDVAPFVNLLSDGLFQLEADVNGDGAVNLLDVGLFVDLIQGD